MTNGLSSRRVELDRLQWRALVVGIVSLTVCVLGAFISPEQFFRSYLTAYLYYLGIALGCLCILMIYYLTGGAWGFLIRRPLEAGMKTLPVLAVLFVPITFGLGYLYIWARPDEVAGNKDIQKKLVYLNVPFFCVRAAIFFASWLALAYLLSRWSNQEDRSGDERASRRLAYLSGPGLMIYGVTITFASVDWVMSLQPAFRSTIFGPIFASGQFLSGLCFAVIVMAWMLSRPPLAEMISLEAINDLGSLVFTFLVIWAYLNFFQFMLIWIANLPHEVSWYIARSQGGWLWVAWALFTFHFCIPFFLLLMRDVKRNPEVLASVSALVLFMQLVFMDYQVLPAFEGTQISEHWMDVLAPLGLGGIWLAYFLNKLKGTTVLPRHDVNQDAAARFRKLDDELAAQHYEVHHA
jgi:hypothetical protein